MAGEKAPRPRSWRSFFMGMAVGLAVALAWQRRKKVVDGSHGPRKRSRRRSNWSNRAPTIEVTLQEGQTLGDVVVKYVGDFTQENLDAVLKLNKEQLKNLDCVQPGSTIVVPDNRKGIYEPTAYASLKENAGKYVGGREQVVDPEALDPTEEAEKFLGIDNRKKKVKGLVLEQDTW